MVPGNPVPQERNPKGAPVVVAEDHKCSNIDRHWRWWESETAHVEKDYSLGQVYVHCDVY